MVGIDTSRILLGSGWNPVPAASCTLLMLAAYSHELHVSLPCSGCCCSVAILAILCGSACDGVGHFAGVVCMISWLWGAGRRRPACQYAPRGCMRVFAAWDGAAKPATLRSLVGGLAGGDVSGRQLSGLPIGFSFQGSSPCTRRRTSLRRSGRARLRTSAIPDRV